MKKLTLLIMVMLIFTVPAGARSFIGRYKNLTLQGTTALNITGSNVSRTFAAAHRVATLTIDLSRNGDFVEIIAFCSGSAVEGDTATINIYGYSLNGPAMRVFSSVLFTLGQASEITSTASVTDSALYADTIHGTNFLQPSVTLTDDAGANGIAKIYFNTIGIRYLYFEPITFVDIDTFTIQVREYGDLP